DLFPAVKGRAKFNRRSAVTASLRSSEMFIGLTSRKEPQLRRSDILFYVLGSYLAPSELQSLSRRRGYKYSDPPGLAATNTRFLTISNDHFSVTYPADVDRRDANQVLNTLEVARDEYLHRASSASISVNVPNLDIRLNQSAGDFTARTGQPWWAAAATRGNRIELQPVAILKRRGVLFTTLRHELAHVVIDSATNKRAPRWLEEGFAIYLAGEGKLFSHYQTRSMP